MRLPLPAALGVLAALLGVLILFDFWPDIFCVFAGGCGVAAILWADANIGARR